MTPRHSYAYLDGVRGWAALMVAYSHFVAAMHPAMIGAGDERAHFAAEGAISRTGLIVLFNPQLSVDIFFVLSGFVLATAVNNRPAPLVELVVRRWLRLALPILGTTALIWPLFNEHLFWPEAAGALSKSDWLLLCYNWRDWPFYPYMTLWRLFSQSLWTVFVGGYPTVGMHWYNPALWTMKMEFLGSVGLFTAYWLLPAAWTRRGAGLVAALVALHFTWQVPLLSSFTYGVALFEVRRLGGMHVALPPTMQTALGLVLLAAGVFFGGVPYDMGTGFYRHLYDVLAPFVGNLTMFSHRFGALCIVSGVMLFPPLQRLLRGRTSQWLGRASFALYLVHVPLLCSLGVFVLLHTNPLLGYNAASLAALAIYLPTALVVAGLVARWIDEPSIRASKPIAAAVLPAVRWAVRVGRRGALPPRPPPKAEPLESITSAV